VILAVADEADPDNKRCEHFLETHDGPLVTTALVVAEAGWLIDRQLGATAEAAFYASIAEGDLSVEPLTVADWQRVAELVDRYADLGLGGVDASLVAIAERLDVAEIATLDHRDFRAVRPRHVTAFTLLP
jgi:predicted nucleic acid-binding protein